MPAQFIPTLPAAAALDGTESIKGVQGGADVAITPTLVGNFAAKSPVFSGTVNFTGVTITGSPTWSSAQTFPGINLSAGNLVTDTSTGTQIATATGQKLGFWGHAPAVQQVLATGAGKAVDDVITFLQAIGLCKQS